ncbi:PucR family transcriptional regulator [Leucobacter zeae]|nr:PucR family transcriptional regulator [Leucobacter zeae]
MTFTVGSLLALPAAGTSSLTPGVGEERPITWGHVCELQEPWRWLGPGALVMTTGIGIPATTEDQCLYLDGMLGAGIAAVAVDEVMAETPFTPEALAHAGRIGFPVLETVHEIRFVTVAMAIAEAAQQEAAMRARRAERTHASFLLDELCDGSLPAEPAARLAGAYDLSAPFTVAAAQPEDTRRALDEAYTACDAAEVSVLATVREGHLVMLVEPGAGSRAVLEELAVAWRGIGVSSRFQRLDELPTAARQARGALVGGHADGRVVHFEEHESSSLFLPNDTDQLRRIARQVLGPLRTYDQQRGTSLTQTLRVFLEENRSWVRASERLFVHRQTLIARISRIEKIIGRDLSSMDDAAECWLAVQAAIGCGDLEPVEAGRAD